MFKDLLYMNFYSDTNQSINLRITDINGREYYNLELSLKAQEVYSHRFTEVNKFANGVYFIIVYTENDSYSRLIIKQ
ncbi:T9SS type A sorting domain-containing protein [Bacteroidota bacterium]